MGNFAFARATWPSIAEEARGTEEWRTAYAMRNVVESANRNLKRTQFENIADPDLRAIHGNTFTYIVVAWQPSSKTCANSSFSTMVSSPFSQ